MSNVFSYSAGLVAKFAQDQHLSTCPYSACGIRTPREHGMKISLSGSLSMSVQTSHGIAGCWFAETKLMSDNRSSIVCPELGYDRCLTHANPEDLFKHILHVIEKLDENEGVLMKKLSTL
jgi:hypothetical protein